MLEDRVRRRKIPKYLIVIFLLCSVMVGLTTTKSITSYIKTYFAAGEVPAHKKEIANNNDGTYKLSLDVTGDVTRKPAKANVVVILDISGSMNTNAGGSSTRLTAAKAAVNSLADSLLAYNNKEGYPNDTIQMALVSFSTHANQVGSITTSASTFKSNVNGLNASGGTNWEAALITANNIDFKDDDETYVIFVSDGNPTFRNTKGNYYPMDNHYYNMNGYGVYGNGSDNQSVDGIPATTTIARCYEHAVDNAKDIVTAGKKFYTIGAYGDVDRMQQLTKAAGAPATNYYSASNTQALEAALKAIMDEIEQSGIKDATILDGTTNKVATSSTIVELLEVDSTSFQYYKIKDGVKTEWKETDDPAPPKAKFDETTGAVTWDLKSIGLLEDKVTYEVTFDVYPSQYTYDLVSELKNGTKKYSELDVNIKKYLTEDYNLRTNTEATLTYTDSRTTEGEKTAPYTNPDPVPTESFQIGAHKAWENLLDSKDQKDLTLTVTRDGRNFYDAKLTSDNSYEVKGINIAPGLMKLVTNNGTTSVKLLDTGHDYTFAELDGEYYNWDLKAETVHPMIIDGTLQNLVLVNEETNYTVPTGMGNNTYYEENGTKYVKIDNSGKIYVIENESNIVINAKNNRRSNLNIVKKVDGESAKEDEKFDFNIKVTDDGIKADDSIYLTIYDLGKKDESTGYYDTVDLGEVAGWTKEVKNGVWSGYYYAPSKTPFAAKLQANWNVLITNLTDKTTYEVTEGTLPQGFVFDASKSNVTASNNTGNITLPSTSYSIDQESKKVTGKIDRDNASFTVEITNVYQLVDVDVEKVWIDDTNDGVKPTSVDVQLYKKVNDIEEEIEEVKQITEKSNWKYTWTKLDRFDSTTNEEINYYVKEVYDNSNIHYVSNVTGDMSSGYTITNTRKTEDKFVNISGEKTWIDSLDQDKVRPTSITVNLLADGTKTATKEVAIAADGKWGYSFNNLPKYKDGKEITYTITEDKVDYYTTTIDGYDITNTHNPFQTEIKVAKVWDDKENQDGKRSDSITVQLKKDGVAIESPVILNKANNWSHTWAKLPRKSNGRDIVYTVEELVVPTGYTTKTEITDNAAAASDNTPLYTITNTHTPEKTSVKVTKVWDDKENQDGIRPTSIDVQLYKDGSKLGDVVTLKESNNWTTTWDNLDVYAAGSKISYTVEEEKTAVITGVDGAGTYQISISGTSEAGYTVTNTHTPEKTEATVKKVWDDANNQDGKRPNEITITLSNGEKAILNETNNWEATIKNLPKYKEGKEIKYTWTEENVPAGYTITDTNITDTKTEGQVTTITNTHTAEETEVTVKKVWDDADNQDGIRPNEIVVTLSDGQTVTLNRENDWTETIKNLPKYKEGKEIKYTWTETNIPTGYELTDNTTDGTITTITNTHKPETTEVTIKKVWDDADNQDGIRPSEIVVTLSNGQSVTLNAVTGWTETIKNLPKYKSGKEIEYTWSETNVPTGYELTGNSTEGTITTLTNTHKTETVNITGTKTWNDADNQDGFRPKEIIVNLLADGIKTQSQTVTIGSDKKWTYSFKNLPKYKIENGNGGKEIVYTITEEKVNEYSTLTNGYDIINTHSPFETEVNVTKSWNDTNNIDGKRPESINVVLKADGIAASTQELNETNNWAHTWSNLPRKKNGKEIVYTIEELVVPTGYTSESTKSDKETTTLDKTVYINSETISVTNTHTPEKTKVFGTKVWNDANNQDGIRPESIKINLLKNGKVVAQKEVSEEDNWQFTWENLDKYELDSNGNGGKLIEYTVKEEMPESLTDSYTTTISGSIESGFTITNTHEPETTNLSGQKIWDDANDQDGIRPESITINVLANNEFYTSKTIEGTNTEDTWNYSFTDLPVYKVGSVGEKITYTVEEVVPEGYTRTIDNNNIINTHIPETTKVSGTKIWDDANNQDGVRPTSITVKVLDNNIVVDTITVTGDKTADSWNYTSKELPKYRNHGTEEIKYTVVEDETGLKELGYTTAIKDTTITNSRTPELVNVPISKTWIDNSNSEGYRPSKVIINLLANKTKVDSVELTGEGNTWTYTFKDKPKYKDGKEIEYSVEEVNVDSHYEVSYPEDDKRAVVNTIKDLSRDIEITKKWIDNENQDGKRPEKITVNLVGMVEKEKIVEKSLEITGEMTTNTWINKFTDLPIFHKGKLISYSINEEDVTDYPTTSIKGDVKEGFIIENTHEIEKISIDATKVWTDGDNQDGLRPEDITINLLANNEIKDSKTIKASNDWKVTFEDLDKYANGKEIDYTIEEANVPEGYDKEIDQKTRTITNTHTPEVISYHVTKIWEDFDNQDGVRPEKITVRLYANDIEINSITISEKENWEYSFEKLPKYKAGKLIKYTITEDNVDLYETDEITTVENTKETKELDNTITNNHELIPYNETGEITVTKTWDDDNNKYNSRPENITVHLFADDEEIDSAILSKENNWTYTFKDLLKYKKGEVGVEINYSITEDKVENYQTAINGFNVTNKYIKPKEPKKSTTPPKLEIIPPKTGVTTDNNNKSLFELLTALITLSYSLVITKKLNPAK